MIVSQPALAGEDKDPDQFFLKFLEYIIFFRTYQKSIIWSMIWHFLPAAGEFFCVLNVILIVSLWFLIVFINILSSFSAWLKKIDVCQKKLMYVQLPDFQVHQIKKNMYICLKKHCMWNKLSRRMVYHHIDGSSGSERTTGRNQLVRRSRCESKQCYIGEAYCENQQKYHPSTVDCQFAERRSFSVRPSLQAFSNITWEKVISKTTLQFC